MSSSRNFQNLAPVIISNNNNYSNTNCWKYEEEETSHFSSKIPTVVFVGLDDKQSLQSKLLLFKK